MTLVTVDTVTRRLCIAEISAPCAIGRSGAIAAADKREGDGATPLGEWTIRGALLRPDHGLAPPARLPWRWLRPEDGWSDDPRDPAYNRPVRHPHAYSAERLWREDSLYDVILWLDHNQHPPMRGAGSAIFVHLREGDSTEGCVAIDRATMAHLLTIIASGDRIAIR